MCNIDFYSFPSSYSRDSTRSWTHFNSRGLTLRYLTPRRLVSSNRQVRFSVAPNHFFHIVVYVGQPVCLRVNSLAILLLLFFKKKLQLCDFLPLGEVIEGVLGLGLLRKAIIIFVTSRASCGCRSSGFGGSSLLLGFLLLALLKMNTLISDHKTTPDKVPCSNRRIRVIEALTFITFSSNEVSELLFITS